MVRAVCDGVCSGGRPPAERGAVAVIDVAVLPRAAVCGGPGVHGVFHRGASLGECGTGEEAEDAVFPWHRGDHFVDGLPGGTGAREEPDVSGTLPGGLVAHAGIIHDRFRAGWPASRGGYL